MYSNVSHYQVLQRDFKTNTASVYVDGKIVTLGVGGPYVVGDAHDVMVGDIWVMAGQSNMRGHGYYDATDLSPVAKSRVHMFRSAEIWDTASEPTHELWNSPRPVHRLLRDPTVQNPVIRHVRGASLGLAFADRYQQLNDGIPVGLIPCAHGGVTLAQWHTNAPLSDDTLYGAMCDRIRSAGGAIAGVLWYQGESDVENNRGETSYTVRMKAWIHDLREVFGDIYFVAAQIGRFNAPSEDALWTLLRTQQARLGSLHKSRVVSTIDCDMDDRVHLSAAGLRLAGHRFAVAAYTLLRNIPSPTSPFFKVVSQDSQRTKLKVEFPGLKDLQYVDRVHGFTILNHVQEELPGLIFSARIEADDVYLYVSPQTGEYLREEEWILWYGYGRSPICNIKDTLDIAPLAGEIPYRSL
ncbi:hypothetical protein DFQ28_008123 [Apophysomyces sp. BC1034]|nr:hypothetical protein DFQ30_006921 [Apophysomyces sp. BC1015]KAG0181531.1 hypothetical protein DFQ29_008087 [Apophysomyces sp. BC1021]KAG0192733.1 hypothetical protein DFQ28_008123 [Apophysomyces sp. BC1034]